jgi:hypothetical protein
MIKLLDLQELAEETKIPEKVLALLVVEGKIPHRMVRGWPAFDPTNLGGFLPKLQNRIKTWDENENQTH